MAKRKEQMTKKELRRSRLEKAIVTSVIVGSIAFCIAKDKIQNKTRDKLYPQVVALADKDGNRNGYLDSKELESVYDLIGKEKSSPMKYGYEFGEKHYGDLSAKDMKKYISVSQ